MINRLKEIALEVRSFWWQVSKKANPFKCLDNNVGDQRTKRDHIGNAITLVEKSVNCQP